MTHNFQRRFDVLLRVPNSTILILAASLAYSSPVAAAEPWKIVFHNKGAKLGETPILTEIKENVPTGVYFLVRDDEPKELGIRSLAPTVEVFVDHGARYIGTSVSYGAAGTSRRYRLEPIDIVLPPGAGCVFKPNGGDLELAYGFNDCPILTHRSAPGSKPYIYPLFGPNGVKMTRSYPMADVADEDHDHPHQRSLWFAHGNVNGFDFWACDPLNKPNKKFGSIRETSREVVTSGMTVGIFRTTDDWLDPDGRVICTDERIVRIFPRPKVQLDDRDGMHVSLRLLFLDYDVTIKATTGPVTFGDTREGLFGLRVASSMDANRKKGGKITNTEGLTDENAWGKASPWVDYVGPVEGKNVGVAVLNHPTSFRYPTTWHVTTYGLFAANPFGRHDFGMKKSGEYTMHTGDKLTFRYRVVLHEGATATANIPQFFQSYAEPPTIEILPHG